MIQLDRPSKMKKILFIIGTRPEAIKMAPLIIYFKSKNAFDIKVCITAQHRQMLDEVFGFFKIVPDFDLNLMTTNQDLFDITALAISKLKFVFETFLPDLIFVQGDTTTAFVGALAGYYKKIKIAHIEAGLRSFDKYSPYPEEMNRKMISSIADFHFTPTQKATEHLLNEGYSENIYQVGNTVIDALLLGIDEIKMKSERIFFDYFNFIDFSNKIILVTAHRRENLGEPLENICDAINYLNQKYDDLTFVFPVHLNPAVRKTVNEKLSGKQNIHLLAPLDYPKLIWLLNKSFLVITDSGGIQEEAPTLGKPILVIRDITERPEGIDAGNAILVGSNKDNIITNFERIYLNNQEYNRISNISNPYGDGTSSKKIFDIICQNL